MDQLEQRLRLVEPTVLPVAIADVDPQRLGIRIYVFDQKYRLQALSDDFLATTPGASEHGISLAGRAKAEVVCRNLVHPVQRQSQWVIQSVGLGLAALGIVEEGSDNCHPIAVVISNACHGRLSIHHRNAAAVGLSDESG